MKGSIKVALGVLGALAAGVSIGLLMAPEKGSDTRKKLKRKAGEWGDQLNSLWSKGNGWMEDVEEKSKRLQAVTDESME